MRKISKSDHNIIEAQGPKLSQIYLLSSKDITDPYHREKATVQYREREAQTLREMVTIGTGLERFQRNEVESIRFRQILSNFEEDKLL